MRRLFLGEMRKRDQGFSNWAGKTNRELFIFNINLDLRNLLMDNWKIEMINELHYAFHFKHYNRIALFDKTDSNKHVLVTWSECDSILLTHESIIDRMCECTVPHFSTGAELGFTHGDVCFGPGFLWSRFNIMVDVSSVGNKSLTIEELKKIDNEINEFICWVPDKNGSSIHDGRVANFDVIKIELALEKDKIRVDGETKIMLPQELKPDDNPNVLKNLGKIAAFGGEIFRKENEYYYRAKISGVHDIKGIFLVEKNKLWIGKAEVRVLK